MMDWMKERMNIMIIFLAIRIMTNIIINKIIIILEIS